MSESAMQVPYVNIAAQHAALKSELMAAVSQVLDHGHFVLGEEVQQFEQCFAALCGVSHAVGVNSGTDALILALRQLGIGPGDEVITVPNSFVATASCIALVGARPVLVDVGDDLNLDPAQLGPAITPRTRAVLVVHLTGRPADMDPILTVAARHGLSVVEDCAQAVLAQYRGRPVGSLGTIGCFSLHPLKTLNACGDGGVLTTNDPACDAGLRIARNLGLKTRDECVVWSGNSRLDTIQAAMLLVKLRHVREWTDRRRANAAWYTAALADIAAVQPPTEHAHETAVYHTYVIQADRRDELKQHLAERGIGSAIHYPDPIHLQESAAALGYRRGDFPVAERQAGRILSLPIYPELTRQELEYVAHSIRAFYGA